MSTAPAVLAGFLEDAGDDARAAMPGEGADRLCGALVVTDDGLPALLRSAAGRGHRIPVVLEVLGGAGALPPAVSWATRDDVLDLRAVVLTLRGEGGELVPNARRISTATDALRADDALPEEAVVRVALPPLEGEPPGHGWLGALDELATGDLRVQLRTGGPDVPAGRDVAECIAAALDRELAFACGPVAGTALRSPGGHGVATLLLATRLGLDGAGTDEVAAVLDGTDRDAVRRLLADHGPGLPGARRWCTAVSVLDPTRAGAELADLGLSGPGS